MFTPRAPTIMLFNSHKKTIRALQQTIAQQASLLEAIDRSMAVIEFDLSGIVLRANDNFPTAPSRLTESRLSDLFKDSTQRFVCSSDTSIWRVLSPEWVSGFIGPLRDASSLGDGVFPAGFSVPRVPAGLFPIER
jgi:hypothetical protein